MRTLEGHTNRAFNVAWSPLLRNKLASGSDDNTIRVWDVTTGESTVSARFPSYSPSLRRPHTQHCCRCSLVTRRTLEHCIGAMNFRTSCCLALGTAAFVFGMLAPSGCYAEWTIITPMCMGLRRILTGGFGSVPPPLCDPHWPLWAPDWDHIRPFYFASSSRDTSFRFWNLEAESLRLHVRPLSPSFIHMCVVIPRLHSAKPS